MVKCIRNLECSWKYFYAVICILATSRIVSGKTEGLDIYNSTSKAIETINSTVPQTTEYYSEYDNFNSTENSTAANNIDYDMPTEPFYIKVDPAEIIPGTIRDEHNDSQMFLSSAETSSTNDTTPKNLVILNDTTEYNSTHIKEETSQRPDPVVEKNLKSFGYLTPNLDELEDVLNLPNKFLKVEPKTFEEGGEESDGLLFDRFGGYFNHFQPKDSPAMDNAVQETKEGWLNSKILSKDFILAYREY